MRKIVYISGTRADYGLMKSVLEEIERNKDLELEIVATGMHLMSEFGNSIDNIKKDGFKVTSIDAVHETDDKESMSRFLGKFIQELTTTVVKIKPNIMLILGDRAEMLGAAIVGNYLSIPIVHLHGGEVSTTVDEHVRHAITKLSHVHLPATEKSAERIQNMGEEISRINVVGAPGVYSTVNNKLMSSKELENEFNIDLNKPISVVLQHPVTLEAKEADIQIEKTLESVKKLGLQTVVIYPNSDAGGRKMIGKIKEYEGLSNFRAFKNLTHNKFLSLISNASLLIGNSSAGCIESSSFKIPVVNIGNRQKGRERASNVIDCDYDEEEITKSIKLALSREFKERIENCVNPYYQENTPQKVCEILSNLDIDEKLLQKNLG